MNATRISRSHGPCRRRAGICGRGGPHRRGRVWRLAHGRARRAPPDHARPTCQRPLRRSRQRTGRNATRAPAPTFQRRRRASRSIYSRAASTCRASFASRRTAISSSRKPERGACGSFARGRLAPARRKARSSPTGVQRVYGIAFYPSGTEPALRLCRDAGLSCALSLSQRRHESLRLRRRRSRACRAAADTGRATSRSQPTTRRCSCRSARPAMSTRACARADQASIAEAPLGASFGDERRRADVLAFDPDGQKPARLRDRHSQLFRPRGSARNRRALVRRQRTRRTGRQPAARLRHACRARRLLWLALVLSRRSSGPASQGRAAGSREQHHDSRRSHSGAFGAARHRLLYGGSVSLRLQRRRLRHAARLVESLDAAPATRSCAS